MEQKTENIHGHEAPKTLEPEQHKYKKPQEQKFIFSSTSTGGSKSPKLRGIRRQAPNEYLEKLSKCRPKVSLTPAEIEEDLKFFAQMSVSEAAYKPESNEVPEVSAKMSKPQHDGTSH